jgi:prepilin-type N-terminal cleavage/methylation domain-containing protein
MLKTMRSYRTDQGFTLVELIVIVAILGIVAAIAAPSWLTLLTRQRLYDARANALDKIREAQTQAVRTARPWEACFRDRDGMVQVSVQPSGGGTTNTCANHTSWQPLLESGANTIAIKTGTPGTTSSAVFGTNPTIGYRFQFGSLGDRIGQSAIPPQLVFVPRGQNNGPFYCVVSETIIGSVREGTIRSGTRCR